MPLQSVKPVPHVTLHAPASHSGDPSIQPMPLSYAMPASGLFGPSASEPASPGVQMFVQLPQ
jgi:hypothetical protein